MILYIVTVTYYNGNVIYFRFDRPRNALQFQHEADQHSYVKKTEYGRHDICNIYTDTDMRKAYDHLNEFSLDGVQ